jgi:NRPS condensation-like uncharacterized protein
MVTIIMIDTKCFKNDINDNPCYFLTLLKFKKSFQLG